MKVSIPFWTDPPEEMPKLKDFEPERDEGWYHLTPEQQRLSDRLSRIEQFMVECGTRSRQNGETAAVGVNTARIVGVLVAVAFPTALLAALGKLANWVAP